MPFFLLFIFLLLLFFEINIELLIYFFNSTIANNDLAIDIDT